MTAAITLYTSHFCGYCHRAKELLNAKGATYVEISVDHEPAKRLEMMELSGRRSVPQIWIGEQHIGGCDDLYLLERQGQLNPMLALVAEKSKS